MPDEKMGEEVCAWIQLNEGFDPTDEHVKGYCRDQIIHFKITQHIRFITEYPMTVTEKIQKFVMRDAMLEQLKS